MVCIENTQDRKMWEKLNPFLPHFTIKTVRVIVLKLINVGIEINSCCSCIQNLKIPLRKSSSFALKKDLIFLGFFHLGCCLLGLNFGQKSDPKTNGKGIESLWYSVKILVSAYVQLQRNRLSSLRIECVVLNVSAVCFVEPYECDGVHLDWILDRNHTHKLIHKI